MADPLVTNWNPLIIAGAAAVPTLVSILGTIRNGWKSDAIHLLVNSNLQEVKDELKAARADFSAANAEILVLRKLVDAISQRFPVIDRPVLSDAGTGVSTAQDALEHALTALPPTNKAKEK